MVYHRVTFLFFEEIPMQNMRTTSFEAITWWPIEISVKFQNRLIGNQGSLIRWSRDQWSRVVTWPAFWKLGQGAAQECGVSRSPMEISEKFQKRLIANQGSPIGWSRDQWSRVVTWPAFWKLGQGAAQECGISRSPLEISEKFQKLLIANQGSPIGWSRDQWSRVVTWPAFWKLGQGAAQECGVSRSPMEISEKFQKRLIANEGSPIGWSRDQWSRVVTWPAFWKIGQGAAQKCGVSDVCGYCNIITLLSLIRIIKQQILMQKLLRSSKLSCSKPFITLLKQQISNCCTVKKSHRAMLCIAYAQSAYDYARLMWIAVGKQCALPVGFFHGTTIWYLLF